MNNIFSNIICSLPTDETRGQVNIWLPQQGAILFWNFLQTSPNLLKWKAIHTRRSQLTMAPFYFVSLSYYVWSTMCQSNMTHCCTPGDFSIKNGLGTLLPQRDVMWWTIFRLEYDFALTVLARNARKLIPREIKVYYSIINNINKIINNIINNFFEQFVAPGLYFHNHDYEHFHPLEVLSRVRAEYNDYCRWNEFVLIAPVVWKGSIL